MNNNDRLFLFVCIPVRLLLVYLVLDVIPHNILQYMSIAGFIIFISFMKQFIDYKEGDKGFFKGPVWWNNARPVHALLYLSAAILALVQPKDAWIPLLIDVLFGLCMYTCKFVPNCIVISSAPTSQTSIASSS